MDFKEKIGSISWLALISLTIAVLVFINVFSFPVIVNKTIYETQRIYASVFLIIAILLDVIAAVMRQKDESSFIQQRLYLATIFLILGFLIFLNVLKVPQLGDKSIIFSQRFYGFILLAIAIGLDVVSLILHSQSTPAQLTSMKSSNGGWSKVQFSSESLKNFAFIVITICVILMIYMWTQAISAGSIISASIFDPAISEGQADLGLVIFMICCVGSALTIWYQFLVKPLLD